MKKQFTILLILVFIFGLMPINFTSAKTISERLGGRLLLQVEQGGAIWYIDTNDLHRYSVTWANALSLFEKLSLGITDNDLSKIPITGSDQTSNLPMRTRLKGKLLLQVQQGGAIWYVDKDGYRHSVTWNNLLPLFQKLSLGITNADLDKISIGELNNTTSSPDSIEDSNNQNNNAMDNNTPTNICISWVYSDWSACSVSGQQTRTIISNSPTNCSGGNPVLTQSCSYVAPTCTSWIYSNWSTCVNSQQTRTITSSLPANCSGGSPVLSQSCNSTPLCTENNWTSVLSPTICPSNAQQTKTWTRIGQCQNGVSHLPETVSCNYQTPTCTSFTYSNWNVCNLSGVQPRNLLSSHPSNCAGGNPILSQSCTYVPPTCTSWAYSNWGTCSVSGQQTRTIISSSPANCSEGNPVLTQSCSYIAPTCISWTYSDWGVCSTEGQQTRTIVSSSPNGCVNGNPLLTQNCVYIQPCSCSDVSKECCASCAMGDICGGGILMNQDLNLVAA